MRRLVAVLILLCCSSAGMLLAQSPDSLARTAQRLEAAGRWREAMVPLEQYLLLVPDDGPRLRQMGQYLTWSGDRARGVAMLRRALALEPDNPATLAVLGEVLSWDPASRQEASDLFRRALVLEPDNVKAREGRANLLAWEGRASRALPIFDSLLSVDPNSVGALRGKGGALNQLQRFAEARALLARGLAIAPDDPGLRQEMAQSAVGLERFGEARRYLEGLEGIEVPLRLLRDSTRRALGSHFGLGGLYRDRTEQLDALRGEGLVSLAMGSAWRVTAGYQYTDFSDTAGHFAGSAMGGGLSFRPDRRFGIEGRALSRQSDGPSPAVWDAGVQARWRPAETVRMTLGFSRDLVEETRRSVQGVQDIDAFRGVVQASIASLAADVWLAHQRIELSGRLSAGRNTGEGLDRNDRFSAEASAGYVVRTYRPYLRIGYAHATAGFDYNASEYAGRVAGQVGGYFSPYRYFLNYGTVTASHRFGRSVFWEFDGRVGGQVTREFEGENADARPAGSLNTHVTWRAGRSTDLDLRYLYSNTFNAFRLHEVQLFLRQYF